MTDIRRKHLPVALAAALAAGGLLGSADPANAGCCKTFPQRHNVVSVQSSRISEKSVEIKLTLDGMIQGPPDAEVKVGQMYGAILVPESWSDVRIDYQGTCAVTLDGKVIAELNTEDPEGARAVMEQYEIPLDGNLDDPGNTSVEKPRWNPDPQIAELAETHEPAPEGYRWIGFSSDRFDVTRIPASLLGARIDGVFTTTITVANAPEAGPVQAVIRGGDLAEGFDTVRVPVLVDSGVIKIKPGDGTKADAGHRGGRGGLWALAGSVLLLGMVAVGRGRKDGGDA